MKIYLNKNVFDAALERIRWLYSEFPNVICSVSGGKDSTVIFHLTLQVARELNRLPLKVLFIDQEAEWQATIDQIRYLMTHPDVEPMWFQIPLVLFNATSSVDHWLRCWDEDERRRWMRPKESFAYTKNIYGTDRFKELFTEIIAHEFRHTPTANIGGVRAEESPMRFMAVTMRPTYKWITWGGGLNSDLHHYTFYPIYDWTYADVWAAIAKNNWPYNKIYDIQFQHGVSVWDMRVSNVHHETAVMHLFYMQEAEPETYARLTQRIGGIDMAAKMGEDYYAKNLPFMFASWPEYRDFLLEKLIQNRSWRKRFRERFDREDRIYGVHPEVAFKLHRSHVQAILTNDFEFTKMHGFVQMAHLMLKKAGKEAWKS